MRYTGPNNKKARRYQYSVLENNKEFLTGKREQLFLVNMV